MIAITSIGISISLLVYNIYCYFTISQLQEELKMISILQEKFGDQLETIEQLELKILKIQEKMQDQTEFTFIE